MGDGLIIMRPATEPVGRKGFVEIRLHHGIVTEVEERQRKSQVSAKHFL